MDFGLILSLAEKNLGLGGATSLPLASRKCHQSVENLG